MTQLDFCKAYEVSVTTEDDEVKDFVFITVDESLNDAWIRKSAKENKLKILSLRETDNFYVYNVFFAEPMENDEGEMIESDIIAHKNPLSVDEIYKFFGEENVKNIDIVYQPQLDLDLDTEDE